jgi:hypothetical protein
MPNPPTEDFDIGSPFRQPMISLEKKRMCFQTLGIQKVTELVYIVKLQGA